MKRKVSKNEKGISLILTMLILMTILVIAFGVANLMLGQINMAREVPRSLRAYYVAEAGIERKLYEARADPPNFDDIGSGPEWCTGTGKVCLDPDTCYAVDVVNFPNPTVIKAFGCYKGTRRAIDVSWSY